MCLGGVALPKLLPMEVCVASTSALVEGGWLMGVASSDWKRLVFKREPGGGCFCEDTSEC